MKEKEIVMEIQLWGVRGSIASPTSNSEYKEKITEILTMAIEQKIDSNNIESFLDSLPDNLKYMYGGNTTCASVKSEDTGNTYIIDCGTGVRELGYKLMEGDSGKGKGDISIFLTHNHWDHIQGIPFFTPIYIPGNTLNFFSPYKNQEEILNGQMISPYFPTTFKDTPSKKVYHFLDPQKRETIQLEKDLTVSFFPLKHPQGSFAYKFEQKGKVFIFATDAEFTGEILERMTDNTVTFFNNADLLVIDSQYTLDESFLKFDWGHTSYTMAVNCGIRWNIKQLVLTHHEPAYSDKKIYENHTAAIEHRNQSQHTSPEILMAREGMIFKL